MENKITVENMGKLVQDTFSECLYKEGEDTSQAIIVEGMISIYGFHPKRILANKETIKMLVNQLPKEFHEGYTFLNMCMNQKGELWGEHLTCEQLLVMAMGLGMMAYCMPRDMWGLLPGQVPYVIIK